MAKPRTGYPFQRPDGSWWARVTFVDSTGKRRDLQRRAESKSNAREIIKQLLEDLEETGEVIVESYHLQLSEYFKRWLKAAAKPRLSERTYADYEDLLRRYIIPALGKKKLSELRPLDIQALYSDMQERGLSGRTIRYTHAVLSSSLKQAVKWGMIARNPAALVDLPRQIRKEMQALSPEDAAQFLEAAAEDRWGIIFKLALITGARPEEYLAFQWKDIDWHYGSVTVRRTVCWRRRGGGWYFGEPKTAQSRRTIPLPPSLLRELSEHKRTQAEEKLKARPDYQNLDLVFATAEGGPLMPQNLFRRHFRPILKRAGLPETIRIYDLRHTCATLLLSEQENPKVVSERLGHANITLTLDTYSHVLPSMQQAATKKLENLLFTQKRSGQQNRQK